MCDVIAISAHNSTGAIYRENGIRAYQLNGTYPHVNVLYNDLF